MIYKELRLCVNHCLYIFVYRADGAQAEVFLQNGEHIGRYEGRQRRAYVDVLDAQAEQCEQHDDSLLLIPCYVEGNGQVVDVVGSENLFQLQSYHSPAIAVVALSGIQHAGYTVYVAQIEFVVFIFGTS